MRVLADTAEVQACVRGPVTGSVCEAARPGTPRVWCPVGLAVMLSRLSGRVRTPSALSCPLF